MTSEQKLRNLIDTELDKCCDVRLPRLLAYISTPEGKEHAADIIFNMCAADGIAVQTAMSILDTDL